MAALPSVSEPAVMLRGIFRDLSRISGERRTQPRIVFFHLPRTGGTAIAKDILFPNFPRSQWCHVNYGVDFQPLGGAQHPLAWTKSKRARVKLLAGHMPFGLTRHFPGPSEYFTMLRDPVQRTISDYYYCRRALCNAAHEEARKLSLIEFVRRGLGLTHNCYARWLSNAIYGTEFRSKNEMLEAARANLSLFAFVGLTEMFDASVSRICERFRLLRSPLSIVNRNQATPAGNSLSSEERRTIIHCNELDHVLYEDCRRRFLAEAAETEPVRAIAATVGPEPHT